MDKELLITLTQLRGVGVKTVCRILEALNSSGESLRDAEALFTFLQKITVSRFKPPTVEAFNYALKQAYEIVSNSEVLGIKILTVFDSSYPEALRRIEDYPSVLFLKGNVHLLNDVKSIAVVGSREVHERLSEDFDQILSGIENLPNPCIVSGLAIGTDSLAHRYALKNDIATIAVMPCGLDKIIPPENKDLAYSIIDGSGLLISEYPIGTNPTKSHFLNRNRIQSGLSSDVVIMQASEKSGTMTTFKRSLEQNKTVHIYKDGLLINSPEFSGNLIISNHPNVQPFIDSQTLEFNLKKSRGVTDEDNGKGQLGLF